jgi:hypothetical protein
LIGKLWFNGKLRLNTNAREIVPQGRFFQQQQTRTQSLIQRETQIHKKTRADSREDTHDPHDRNADPHDKNTDSHGLTDSQENADLQGSPDSHDTHRFT